jgi:hypothetical protein
MRRILVLPALLLCLPLLAADKDGPKHELKPTAGGDGFMLFRAGDKNPLLVQNCPRNERPFIHPLLAPDGKGVLTELSPSHHKHQTGIYVGFLKVNGRDYFHNRGGDYFRQESAQPTKPEGGRTGWKVIYQWLGPEKGTVLLTETQEWTLSDLGSSYLLDLAWSAKAETDVTFGKYDYGGLFVRMPWQARAGGEAINSDGKKNSAAEGQRARWVDIGMPIEGRDDWGHIAILDHKENPEHPTLWRVDGQLGVGPARSRFGDWKLAKGETAKFQYRFVVYCGKTDVERVEAAWKGFGK